MYGGAAWNGNGFGSGDEARKLWQAWGDRLRDAGGEHPSAQDMDWQQALHWWSQLLPKTAAGSPLGDVLDKLNAHGSDWYAQMQQLAAHFAGKDAQPAEIVALWRQMLGAQDDPFREIFEGMHGQGARVLDAWIEQAAAWLQAMSKFAEQQGAPMSRPAREFRDRWQRVEALLRDCRERHADYSALVAKAVQQAFDVFERKLGEHAAQGVQIETARALFDIWIDATEEAYSRIALSAEFRHAMGELINAQMRLRAAAQKEAEQVSEVFGMPTRQEVDAAHRKIAELERAVRRLMRAQATGMGTEPPVAPSARKASTGATPKKSTAARKTATAGMATQAASESTRPARATAAKTPSARPGRRR